MAEFYKITYLNVDTPIASFMVIYIRKEKGNTKLSSSYAPGLNSKSRQKSISEQLSEMKIEIIRAFVNSKLICRITKAQGPKKGENGMS